MTFFTLSNRRGAALPMALLVITALTAALAAGFAGTAAEIATNSAERAQNRAYNFAQSGLEQFLAKRNQAGFCTNCAPNPLVTNDSTRVTFAGGYADVVAVRVWVSQPGAGSGGNQDGNSQGGGASGQAQALFLIRSRGVDTATKLGGAGNATFAQRMVAVYANWNPASLSTLGAWTSLSGLEVNGASATVTGKNGCAGFPDSAGITVPTDGYGYQVSTDKFVPTGSPGLNQTMTTDTLKAAMGIDWNGIVNQGAITANYTNAWPSPSVFSNPNAWPVVHFTGSSTPDLQAGRGLLIVDGDLTVNGNVEWDGLILVGGMITVNGNATLSGATMTGLNMLLGQNIPHNATGNGTKTIQYNSCDIANALQGLSTYRKVPNTWSDNLMTW